MITNFIENLVRFMAAPPSETRLHEDFVLMCTHHGFKPEYTLSNQIEGSFLAQYQNFDNIQGTVSYPL